MFIWHVQRMRDFLKWNSLPVIDQLRDFMWKSQLLAHAGKLELSMTQAPGPSPASFDPALLHLPWACVALSLTPAHFPSLNPHSQKEAADAGRPLKGSHLVPRLCSHCPHRWICGPLPSSPQGSQGRGSLGREQPQERVGGPSAAAKVRHLTFVACFTPGGRGHLSGLF